MDWRQAIKKNREALAVVIAELMAMLDRSGAIPRPVYRSAFRILRPAESALRRLIVIVAAMLHQKAGNGGAKVVRQPLPDFANFARKERQPAFALVDPRKRFCGLARPFGAGTPRISVPGFADAMRPVKTDDESRAAALHRRILKLELALKTLPRQARRLNRLMARRAKAEPGPGRTGPIRPGHPPGFRNRSRHPVDGILRDCHCLALESGFKPP